MTNVPLKCLPRANSDLSAVLSWGSDQGYCYAGSKVSGPSSQWHKKKKRQESGFSFFQSKLL